MLLNRERQTFRTTTDSGLQATWTRERTTASIAFIRCPASSEPAYRILRDGSRRPTPAVQPGTISFDPISPPDLAAAREWLPHLNELWDAVRAELWSELISPADRAGHSSFFDVDGRGWGHGTRIA